MAFHLFDTSALAKHYHPEVGTDRVDELLAMPGCQQATSRLGAVEFHSVFAKKVRTGELTSSGFAHLSKQFNLDIYRKTIRVIRLLVGHYRLAEQLIRQSATARNLRTLDALQLAVAIQLNVSNDQFTFVTADLALASIAAAEGLTVINPETP
ncbi:hypothetical protein BH11PLA2_BH11PLA2_18590 [soil metagenome]